MLRVDIERRIRHIEKRLATEDLADWEREMITKNLREYEKELGVEHTCENMTARRQ